MKKIEQDVHSKSNSKLHKQNNKDLVRITCNQYNKNELNHKEKKTNKENFEDNYNSFFFFLLSSLLPSDFRWGFSAI